MEKSRVRTIPEVFCRSQIEKLASMVSYSRVCSKQSSSYGN